MVVVLVILSFALMMGISWYLEERKKSTSSAHQVAGLRIEPIFAQDGGEPIKNLEEEEEEDEFPSWTK